MIALDTNVLVRLLVEDDAAQAARARRLVEACSEAGDVCLVSIPVLCELEWVLESVYRAPRADVEEAVRSLDFPSLTILRPGFLDGKRAEFRPMERVVGAVLRFAGPFLPPSARVSPVSRVVELLIEAAIEAAPGTRFIGAAQIGRRVGASRLF